jgi:hypothetical protein
MFNKIKHSDSPRLDIGEEIWFEINILDYCTLGNSKVVKDFVLEEQWRLKNRNNKIQQAILEALEFISRDELLYDWEVMKKE